jgi:cystathionine beta-lyase/cystathionine gamma-synthase
MSYLPGAEPAGAALRQGEPVGGSYAVTGTLPTLDDVIAFKEGTAQFDHGYYRFVSHPRVRQLEAELKSRFGFRHCKLTESVQTAVRELILCLRAAAAPTRVFLLGDEAAPSWLSNPQFLPACDREGVTVSALAAGAFPGAPDSFHRADILLVLGSTPWILSACEAAEQARASVVVVLASGAEHAPARPEVPGARFLVLGLRRTTGPDLPEIRAGAILGNVDRVMDRLALQVTRRGAILSSRAAESLFGRQSAQRAAARADAAAPSRVAAALCRMERGEHAFLYCSGMTAVSRVLDSVRRPGRDQVIAVGHLYNDTYQSLLVAGGHFLGVDELDRLGALVSDRTAAIFTETITNPLGDVPDLDVLSRAARSRGIPLIVDNTIATPENCRPLDFGADYVIHSTTKYLNGRNDHAGGAVIMRDPALAGSLAEDQALLDDAMSYTEAAVLEGRLGSLPERMSRFNANAVKIADFLTGQSGVARVFFNGLDSHRGFATARRFLRGPSSVISFRLFNDTWEGLRAFYDSPLKGILKAPSLGSDVTLLCPYTLLTHHGESDEELESIGLPRFLLRVSAGCEADVSPVIESLREALLLSMNAGNHASP